MKTWVGSLAVLAAILLAIAELAVSADSDSYVPVDKQFGITITPGTPEWDMMMGPSAITGEADANHAPIPPVKDPSLQAAKFLPTEYISYAKNGTAWRANHRSRMGYDAGGNNSELLIESWNGSEWQPEWQEESTYIYGDKTSSREVWRSINGPLNDGTLFECRFGPDELVDSARIYWWISGEWKQQYRYHYEYVNGHAVESHSESFVNGAWQPSGRGFSLYSPTGKVIEAWSETWTGTIWRGVLRSLRTYYPSDLEETITNQEWKNNGWRNTYRYKYDYDSAGQQIAFTALNWANNTWNEYLWDTLTWVGGQFVESKRHYNLQLTRSTNTYDGFGNWIERMDWKWTGSSYNLTGKQTISYIEQPCGCLCHGDPKCDGATDVIDVVNAIGIAFRNSTAISDHSLTCTRSTTDVNCSGTTDVLDIVKTVNVAFRNADPATEYCEPCP